MKLNIGIMGGTFNPIHNAHISIVWAAKRALCLDAICFIPTGQPPHKDLSELAPARDRLKMVELAIYGIPFFFSDSIEVERRGMTYTVDTLRYFKLKYKNANLCYIIGADTLMELETWRDFKAVASMTDFAVLPRPGYDKVNLMKFIMNLQSKYGNKYHFIDTTESSVSSTEIRKGRISCHDIDSRVASYIKAAGLYVNSPELNREQCIERLESALTKKRFNHTMAVVKSAETLAAAYGAPVHKASVAALLHDCAKEKGDGSAEFERTAHGLGLEEAFHAYGANAIHGLVGSAWARRFYGQQDPEVLQAIANHTLGSENLSLLDKVVLVADFIEENRTYEGVEDVRRAAEKNLDAAVREALAVKMRFVISGGRALHPETVLAYNSFIAHQNDGEVE